MQGFAVEQVTEVKVTGFTFDHKLTWAYASHIAVMVKKAKQRLGALKNLSPYLDSKNMEIMYTAFVRSILEYGNVLYMGADKTHLEKLDTVQRAAERLGGFKVESLKCRREAAALALALKLLDGKSRLGLNKYAPVLIDGHNIDH